MQGKIGKNRSRSIVAAAAIAPLALVAPIEAYAVVVNEQVSVLQSISEVVPDQIYIGDSLIIDLDDIFEDSDELYFTVINYNPDVADVRVLSGDLHIGGKNTGSTIVGLLASYDSDGLFVREEFEIKVVQNSGLQDAHNDGITIDDIVRYMKLNPEQTFDRQRVGYLLGQIKLIESQVNQSPVSTVDEVEVLWSRDQGEQLGINLSNYFYDADGDSLTYTVDVLSSGSMTSASITDNSDVSLMTNASIGSSIWLEVNASDGIAENYIASKRFNVKIENSTPNHAPEIDWENSDYSLTMIEDEPDLNQRSGQIVASDPDGDSLTYSIMNGFNGMMGYATIDSNSGEFVYTPNPNAYGADSFTVQVDDGRGGIVSAWIEVNIEPVNDAPDGGNPPAQYAAQGAPFSYEIPINELYSDPDGDDILFDVVVLDQLEDAADSSWLNIEVNPDTGNPVIWGTPGDQTGVIYLRLTIRDEHQAGNFKDFTITVDANSAP
jgi:VCBS repeat-containing protein